MTAPLRCRSAPPFAVQDVGREFILRDSDFQSIETGPLTMDPKDLAKFSFIQELYSVPSRAIYFVDEDKILKLYSYLIDVDAIVSRMNLARTKVPVPRVYRHGRSGNCAFILMEDIPQPTLAQVMRQLQWKSMPRNITSRIEEIVRDLASLGLSHNDLVPRNVLVDGNGNVGTIIDWDNCAPLHEGGEYARSILSFHHSELPDRFLPGEEDWHHIFLRYSSDRTLEELLFGCSEWHPKRSRPLPLVQSMTCYMSST